MRYHQTWSSLISAGCLVGRYFDWAREGTGVPPLDPGADSFSLVNAWWLAELSRLAYRAVCDDEEWLALFATRREILAEHGFGVEREVERATGGCTVYRMNAGRPPLSAGGPLVVAFRGVSDLADLAASAAAILEEVASGGSCHQGLLLAWDQIRDELLPWLIEEDASFVFSGHSQGGGLALVAAADLAARGKPPTGVYTYGSMRPGDEAFVASLAEIPVWRIVNGCDPVTSFPVEMGALDWREASFSHVGTPYRLVPGEGDGVQVRSNDSEGAEPLDDGPTLLKMLKQAVSLEKPLQPPACLADHSLCNYVARLESALRGEVQIQAG